MHPGWVACPGGAPLRRRAFEWPKRPVTPSRMTAPLRSVTPTPSKRRLMRGRIVENALNARREGPPPARRATGQGEAPAPGVLSEACSWRSGGWFVRQHAQHACMRCDGQVRHGCLAGTAALCPGAPTRDAQQRRHQAAELVLGALL